MLSLIFKLFIIDTYFKDEIKIARLCSMFISDYMPQFFLDISCCLVSAKAVMLYLMSKNDTIATHIQNSKRRNSISNKILLFVFFGLFVLMNIRYTNSCYRVIDVPLTQEYLFVRTFVHYIIIYSIKLFSLLTLLVCFILMRNNKYVYSENPTQYYLYLASFLIIIGATATIEYLLTARIINANRLRFVLLFFFDVFYIIVLTTAVIFFR